MRGHRPVPCLLATASLLAAVALLAACTSPVPGTGSSATPPQQSTAGLTGIHKIRHVIIVMQENRSFDSYFGTYPGADGIPMRTACRRSASRTPPAAAAAVPRHRRHQRRRPAR